MAGDDELVPGWRFGGVDGDSLAETPVGIGEDLMKKRAPQVDFWLFCFLLMVSFAM